MTTMTMLCDAAYREGRGCADNLDDEATSNESSSISADPREWADDHRADGTDDLDYWLGAASSNAQVIEAFYAGLHARACEIADERERFADV